MSYLPDVVALVMLGSLAFYTVSGGADFGAGIWDLLAAGPRAADQRRLIQKAIAPIWEANHVWLIFLIVVLFTAFPRAFAAAGIALYVPLSLALLGIVLRGSSFVFRQYGVSTGRAGERWGRLFALTSTITPIFLGITLGAITEGRIRVPGDAPTTGPIESWLGLFPVLTGLLVTVLFAFVAAVYLSVEAEDPALQEDFRRRAIGSGIVLCAIAWSTTFAAGPEVAHLWQALLGSWWSVPLQVATGGAALGTFAALARRRYRGARVLAVIQASLIVLGWGLGQRPYLIAPDVTIGNAAAPRPTLIFLLAILVAGAVVLLPSLRLLLGVFKGRRDGLAG